MPSLAFFGDGNEKSHFSASVWGDDLDNHPINYTFLKDEVIAALHFNRFEPTSNDIKNWLATRKSNDHNEIDDKLPF